MNKTLSPLTETDEVQLLSVIEVSELIHAWHDTFSIDVSQELGLCTNIRLYQCNQTKLKFFIPTNIKGSSHLYEQLQQFDWYYMPEKWEYQISLENLLGCQRILEIGSGHGSFLRKCIEVNIDPVGIEVNEAAVKLAQDSNLSVKLLDLQEAADFYSESLDAVCSFQVLEHVSNPKDFIESSIKMLKPGGKLIYCVPNAESFLKYQYNLLDMPPHHMLQWSLDTFKSLEKIFSIKLEKALFEPLAEYHISAYLNSYTNYFRSKSKVSQLFFNRFTLPLYSKCLRLGMRKLCKGQSLYVQFRKL